MIEKNRAASDDFMEKKEKLEGRIWELEEVVRGLEEKNKEVRKHMSEMVDSNNDDKIEAIDSLREEYELQVREAVEETKRLVMEEMEGDIKKLKIEIDVYSKTLVEVRQQHRKTEEMRCKLEKQVEEYRTKIVLLEKQVYDADARAAVSNQNEILDNEDTDVIVVEAERRVAEAKEKEFDERIERIREELRVVWEAGHKADVEEAVARARLDWLKRLPEMQQKGGAARESLGEVEVTRKRFEEAQREKEAMGVKLASEVAVRKSKEEELQQVIKERDRAVAAAGREGKREAEDRLGKELSETLRRQQEQWERIVKTAREEAEEQRRLVVEQYELQMGEIVRCRGEERGEGH